MGEWEEDYDENPDEVYEENLDEIAEEEVEEELLEGKLLEEVGLPREWWTESIEKIKYPELRQREIENALEIDEKDKELERRLDSGEISQSRYDHERLVVLGGEKADFATRCDFESEGMSYDDFGILVEKVDFIAKGDPKMLDRLDRIDQSIDRIGPDASRKIEERRRAEGKLHEPADEIISRHIRAHKK